jgi:hypothetical protein
LIVSELIGRAGDKKGLDTNNESIDEDVDDDEKVPSKQPHKKDLNDVSNWLNAVEPDWDGLGDRTHPTDLDQTLEDEIDTKLPRLSEYKEFIKSSESYRWLVCKLRQHERLSFGEHNFMDEIGSRIRKELRAQVSLRKMSIRKAQPEVHVRFNLQWHPKLQVKDYKNQRTPLGVLENTLCLTGSWCEAQAMTVADYMRQTWSTTGEAVVCLFEKLMCLPIDYASTSKKFFQDYMAIQ